MKFQCDRCKKELEKKEIYYEIFKRKVLLNRYRSLFGKYLNDIRLCESCYNHITVLGEGLINDAVRTKRQLKYIRILFYSLLGISLALALFHEFVLSIILFLFDGLILWDIEQIKKYLKKVEKK